jgi:serine/threonine-protein kinase
VQNTDETTVDGEHADLSAQEPEVEVLKPGTELGTFRIEELLGIGGMGCVYRAKHKLLGREVALKVLRPEYAANKRTARRFFSEARAANRINHPNIIEITDFVEDAEQPFFVMEYLHGQSLSDVIKGTNGPLPTDRALDIATQTCRALAVAHDGGIVHRDLKPGNIFITTSDSGDELVKLLDFGVAKIQQDAYLLSRKEGPGDKSSTHNTQSGALLGTPEYMSPEQLGGKPVAASSDLYSLGLVLYEMLAGRKAFQSHSLGDAVLQHLTATVTPIAEARGPLPALPRGLDNVITNLLEKDPLVRPGNASIIGDRLDAIRRGEPLEIDVVEPPAPRARWPLVAAFAVVIVATVVVTALAGMRDDPAGAATKTPLPSPPPAARAPAPPAQPAKSEVEVRLESEPAGATVFVEGSDEPIGTTPFVTTLRVADGSRNVEVRLAGHRSAFALLRATEGEVVRVRLDKDPTAPKPVAARKPSPSTDSAPDPAVEPTPTPTPKPKPKPKEDPGSLSGVIDPFGK